MSRVQVFKPTVITFYRIDFSAPHVRFIAIHILIIRVYEKNILRREERKIQEKITDIGMP